MNRREVAVAELEGRIGHVFHDRELLERALTHASVGDGAHKVRHYERLEFLGDRVLNLLAAERLMALNSEAREGEMSRLMAGLVNYHACARVARRIGLPSALRMAHSASKIGARDKDTVLGDACEALIEPDVEFVDVHEQKAYVGFVDGLHGAEDGEFLDAGFLLALAADASGVEEFDGLLVVADADAIYITSGAGDVCDNRLLLARQRVKEVALADVWATDECDANDVVLWGFGDRRDVRGDLVE